MKMAHYSYIKNLDSDVLEVYLAGTDMSQHFPKLLSDILEEIED